MRTHEHGNTLCSCVPHHAPCSRRRPPHAVRPIPPAPTRNPTNASEALRTARDTPPAPAHGPAYPAGIRTTAPADLTAGQAARAARNAAAEQAARTPGAQNPQRNRAARSAEPAAARMQSGLFRRPPNVVRPIPAKHPERPGILRRRTHAARPILPGRSRRCGATTGSKSPGRRRRAAAAPDAPHG